MHSLDGQCLEALLSNSLNMKQKMRKFSSPQGRKLRSTGACINVTTPLVLRGKNTRDPRVTTQVCTAWLRGQIVFRLFKCLLGNILKG